MPALANEKHAEEKAQHYLQKMDTDGNGAVSRAEHDAFSAQMFTQADTDNDGSVSLAEMIAKKEREKAEWKAMKGDKDE